MSEGKTKSKAKAATLSAVAEMEKDQGSEPALPPGWSRWFTTEGKPYFWNAETRQRTWTNPSMPTKKDKASSSTKKKRAAPSESDDNSTDSETERGERSLQEAREAEWRAREAQRELARQQEEEREVAEEERRAAARAERQRARDLRREREREQQLEAEARGLRPVNDRDRQREREVERLKRRNGDWKPHRDAPPFNAPPNKRPLHNPNNPYALAAKAPRTEGRRSFRDRERDDDFLPPPPPPPGRGYRSPLLPPHVPPHFSRPGASAVHPDLYSYRTLLHPGVQLRFDALFSWQRLKREDIDQNVLETVGKRHPAVAMEVLDKFAEYDLDQVKNKSAFLTGMIRKAEKLDPKHDYIQLMKELPDDSFFPAEVQAHLDSLFAKGLLQRDQLDQSALEALAALPQTQQQEVLDVFSRHDLMSLRNPSSYLTSVVRTSQRAGNPVRRWRGRESYRRGTRIHR
eukprot:TRINITY_DN60746_c0_g1_i1.p1 TRINITY_DN60746_c0_g1~~TRINITY_DN60746_c0_g1_i1.p1  ORF type:complete len:460 (+),score=55.76 TRINITY_DN60746_c0_g1_i1:121-1500(+)